MSDERFAARWSVTSPLENQRQSRRSHRRRAGDSPRM